MPVWEEHARTMLGLERGEAIPEDLYLILNSVDCMVALAGGRLRSRQEIAGIIAMWEYQHRDDKT